MIFGPEPLGAAGRPPDGSGTPTLTGSPRPFPPCRARCFGSGTTRLLGSPPCGGSLAPMRRLQCNRRCVSVLVAFQTPLLAKGESLDVRAARQRHGGVRFLVPEAR
jgi:hypothetical protein